MRYQELLEYSAERGDRAYIYYLLDNKSKEYIHNNVKKYIPEEYLQIPKYYHISLISERIPLNAPHEIDDSEMDKIINQHVTIESISHGRPRKGHPASFSVNIVENNFIQDDLEKFRYLGFNKINVRTHVTFTKGIKKNEINFFDVAKKLTHLMQHHPLTIHKRILQIVPRGHISQILITENTDPQH